MNQDVQLQTLGTFYKDVLLNDVIPFWLRHAIDHEHGGIITSLDRDGSILDTDKSIWFQGRSAWTFATLYNTVEKRPEWLAAAESCIRFLRRHAYAPDGKMYFTVTREGRPLRMRRYVFSEAFAAIALAAYSRATAEQQAAEESRRCFAMYLRHSFEPGVMPPKVEAATRPAIGIAPHMIAIATAQELRQNLGDVEVAGQTCSQRIDQSIATIDRLFVNRQHKVVLEQVAPDGSIIDHFDGRTLNPGHAIECAWFILHEARHRGNDRRLIDLGCTILDWMWERGWDTEHGGILYFRDVFNKPVQEYWHDMKFWWPHNEAIIATLLAYRLTGSDKYAQWHKLVHDWAFTHFPDREHGEWYGYLHRDGTPSVRLKGNMWKGPFHLPRMLWYCWKLCQGWETPAAT